MWEETGGGGGEKGRYKERKKAGLRNRRRDKQVYNQCWQE